MVKALERSSLQQHEEDIYRACVEAQASIDQKQAESERFEKVLTVYAGAQIAAEQGFKHANALRTLTSRIETYHPAHWFGYVFSEGSSHLRRTGMIATRDPSELLDQVIETQDMLFERLEHDDYSDAPRLLSRLHTAERVALSHKDNPLMANIGSEIQSIVRETYNSIDKGRLIDVLVRDHLENAKLDILRQYGMDD